MKLNLAMPNCVDSSRSLHFGLVGFRTRLPNFVKKDMPKREVECHGFLRDKRVSARFHVVVTNPALKSTGPIGEDCYDRF